MKVVIFIIVSLICFVVGGNNKPEQIRLGYVSSDMTKMSISYTTGSNVSSDKGFDNIPATVCVYGTSPTSLTQSVVGTNVHFVEGENYKADIHECVLTDLVPGEKYYYQVGDKSAADGLSSIGTFKAGAVNKWAIYGDYGFTNREQSYDALMADSKKGLFDGVFHVGDIAYDLHNMKGKRGDEFMLSLEPITSTMPYLVVPGNHEKYNNFTHYANRFWPLQHLGDTSDSKTLLWYSFNQPYAHIITFNTEVYSYYRDQGQIDRQLRWMEEDLKKYNTPEMRREYPWLISVAHKCDWQDEVEFDDFRVLLHKYGVDVHICGHQHNYQRLYPGLRKNIQSYPTPNLFVDPKFWVQIVVGSPGCQEKISSGTAPFTGAVASKFLSYGYGILEIHNSTHLDWKWKQTNVATSADGATHLDQIMIALQEQNGDDYKDNMTIIQTNHGPRA